MFPTTTGPSVGRFSQVTGAESVAAMLSANCTLMSLNLAWNSLRKDSAVTVAESLRYNRTLTSLGLAHNRFSDHASQVLGSSLEDSSPPVVRAWCYMMQS